MLNFDVKRKINTLRDILVGKVPDPKAQVEQITIALIYKFMDDMDIEGMEFGGSREFFKEDYEKYAWTNIMQPENSGQQRSNLYAEGIDKMTMNPYLPQLFRDIFRGAYVPYRDAETLNMFLKEINDFRYDHSEELGNAFEYLLSIMGSQGDAGQFRTPRHIIDMIVEIVDPQKTDSILDPACGTAGFLISSYRHILEKNKDNDGNSTLSADERKRLTENFAGYDISPDMVRLSRVNMYLHKFTKPQISEYDTLSSLDKWDETYDVILANPPFMTPKGGIIPHNRYRIQAKRAEVLFVDYIAEHLNPTGKAGVIVPEGIVFQSANAYKNLRKYLVEDDLLYAVISLPAGVFNPYSGVKTSILLMDRTLAKQMDDILFVKINNDGYDLGTQRREIKGSDIPEVINIIKDYQNGIDVSDNSLVTIACKKDIAEQDYILVGERYKDSIVVDSDYPMVELGEICDFKYGKPLKQEDRIDGEYPVYGSNGVVGYHNDFLVTAPFIIIGRKGSAGSVVFSEKNGFPIDTTFYVDEAKNCNLKYLYQILRMLGLNKINTQAGVPGLNRNDAYLKKIPLPPLHIQEEIVKEIEGYQKIIDGARQVVENYRPTIKIDPSWETVKLGDVFKLSSGRGLPSKNRTDGSYNVYGGNGITGYHNEYFVDNKTIVIGRVGEYCGAVHITTEKCWVTDNALMVTEYLVELDQEYLLCILNQINLNQYAKVGGQPSISQSTVYNISIPLPALPVQQQIANKINEEIAIVEQNKRLIEIFQQKIKDKISEVWGE